MSEPRATPKRVIEIRHDDPADFFHWQVLIDGQEVPGLTGFTLDVGMDRVPELTIRTIGIEGVKTQAQYVVGGEPREVPEESDAPAPG